MPGLRNLVSASLHVQKEVVCIRNACTSQFSQNKS